MELYKFESIEDRNNKEMLSEYEDILIYNDNHDFTFRCTDGDVRIRKQMLYYHVPDMETLLNAQMKEASENTEFDVDFSTDDIKYMIWFSISGLFWMDGELDDYEYISWDRWVHRFEVLDYFFQGDDRNIKQSIGNIIKMSTSEDDVDMNFITTLIYWEFDVTPYSDKIARLIFDSPFDLEFTRSILSIPLLEQGAITVLLKKKMKKVMKILKKELKKYEDEEDEEDDEGRREMKKMKKLKKILKKIPKKKLKKKEDEEVEEDS